MGYLCWRDIVDMLWGIANGLERIHDHGLYHGNLHGGNLLVENEPESIDTRIADVGLHDPSQISEQFDAAEEKKFLDLENKQFTKPEQHPNRKGELLKYTTVNLLPFRCKLAKQLSTFLAKSKNLI
ncbi:11029_t:CDS:2 [Dentiscutata erythropus]|uniref:11029_t:CDS:1 n=1 Tax=Dentiscutata erythropus TaxID=1348616 RepID=A0A9N9GPV0_9GLOM|nr:11029_t:CDS:2 [Dentiscutata erythropus]